jgi:triacylglycerol lipase
MSVSLGVAGGGQPSAATGECPGLSPASPRRAVLGALSRAGRAGRDTGRAGAAAAWALLRPAGVAGVAVEAVWCTAHLAVYPWGLLSEGRAAGHRYRLEDLAPVQRGLVIRDVEAAGTPILLVHGMVDNRSVFTLLRRRLLRRGFGRVHSLNYSLLTNDVRAAARLLSARVEELVAETGYERIHVVGHSLGGLIARYYVQRLGGHERVHTLVTLGTPHGGTRIARLLPATLCRQLSPGSSLLAELDEPAPQCDTRFISYWSDLDHMVTPQRNGRIVHPDLSVRNVLVRGVGHMSLPIQGRLVHEISTALSQLDQQGHTLTRGVTTLDAGGSPRGTPSRPRRAARPGTASA